MSDIHGRYDLLKNVVDEWVRFENGDQLILVGDYIDGDVMEIHV
ncbi:MAG: metallophosphoesterase [Longibaculum sp.]